MYMKNFFLLLYIKIKLTTNNGRITAFVVVVVPMHAYIWIFELIHDQVRTIYVIYTLRPRVNMVML